MASSSSAQRWAPKVGRAGVNFSPASISSLPLCPGCHCSLRDALFPSTAPSLVPLRHLLLLLHPSVCLSAAAFPLSSNWPQGPRSLAESHKPSIVLGMRSSPSPLACSPAGRLLLLPSARRGGISWCRAPRCRRPLGFFFLFFVCFFYRKQHDSL